ncbi:unnamed protein product, partial [Prorocentrum cordatum]
VLRNAISGAQRAKVPMQQIVAASRALEKLVSAGPDGPPAAPPAAPAGGAPRAGGPAAGGGGHGEEMRQWSLCVVEQALLRCRKRKALAAEDFDLAQAIKEREVAAASRLALARDRCAARPGAGADACALPAELSRVRAQKRKAVEDEDFDLAAELRQRELEVSSRLGASCGAEGGSAEGAAVQAALAMLRDLGPQALLLACHEGVSECVADAGDELFEEAAAELGAAAAGAAEADEEVAAGPVGATAGAPRSPEE